MAGIFHDAYAKIFGTHNPQIPQNNNPGQNPQQGQPQQLQQPNPTNNPQNNPPPQQTQQTQQTDANGVVPKQEPSPTDQFKTLWETPAPDEKDQNQLASVSVDPAKLMEAAGKVDFRKVMDPELLKKVAAGGEESIAALSEMLNKTVQTVYGHSVVAANKMVTEAVNLAEQRFAAQVPTLVKKQAASEKLFSENAAFQDPMVQPLIAAVQAQIAAKNPKATAADIEAYTKKYLAETAKIIAPAAKDLPADKKKAGSQSAPESEDWSDFLN